MLIQKTFALPSWDRRSSLEHQSCSIFSLGIKVYGGSIVQLRGIPTKYFNAIPIAVM